AAAANAGRDGAFVPLRRAGSVAGAPRSAVCLSVARLLPRRVLRAGRITLAGIRWKFELAGTDLVSGELFDHRVPAEVSPLLRRRFSHRVPNRFGPNADDQWRRAGVNGSLIAAILARCQRPPASVWPLGKIAARPTF